MRYLVVVLSLSFVQNAYSETNSVAQYLGEKPAFEVKETTKYKERGEIYYNYVPGAVIGTVLGLGTGHAIQHRWSKRGTLFTIGQLLGLVAIYAGNSSVSIGSSSSFRINRGDSLLSTIGGFTYVVSRIYEIIDVWKKPKSQQNLHFKQKSVAFVPAIGKNYGGLQFLASF